MKENIDKSDNFMAIYTGYGEKGNPVLISYKVIWQKDSKDNWF